MEWVLAHMEDPDFNDPLPAPAAPGSAAAVSPSSTKAADPDSLAMLTGMGFTNQQVQPRRGEVCSEHHDEQGLTIFFKCSVFCRRIIGVLQSF